MDVFEKYLPVGTVVLLKGGQKRVMIIGFCVVSEEDKEKLWDYSGCLFPEGVLSSSESCLFNHDQIEKVYHLGLIDEEDIKFKENLNKFIDKLNQKDGQLNEKENLM